MAYLFITGLNFGVAVKFILPDPKLDGLGVFSLVLNPLVACRLILMLRRRVDPTTTTEDRKGSADVRDAVAQLQAAENDEEEGDHDRKIESWN